MSAPKLDVRPLRPDDWALVEQLFGARGACGGCWCMLWRAPYGGKRWRESLGEPNRFAFKEAVESGGVYGCLAFRDGNAVGWCSIGPRGDFPGLARSRVLKTDWDDRTWSITCFYIPARERGKGVATALLREALAIAAAHGARSIEAYPVVPKGARVPAAFAWTGVPSLFERAGFRRIVESETRPVYRRELEARGRRSLVVGRKDTIP